MVQAVTALYVCIPNRKRDKANKTLSGRRSANRTLGEERRDETGKGRRREEEKESERGEGEGGNREN